MCLFVVDISLFTHYDSFNFTAGDQQMGVTEVIRIFVESIGVVNYLIN